MQSSLLIPYVHQCQVQVGFSFLGLLLLSVHVELLLQYNSIFYTFEIILLHVFLKDFCDVFEFVVLYVGQPQLLSYSVRLNV